MSIDYQCLEILRSGSMDEYTKVLVDFNSKNEKSKNFNDLDTKMKEDLWSIIFSRITSPESQAHPELVKTSLNSLRILSREKNTLESVITDERMLVLLDLSGLKTVNVSSKKVPVPLLRSKSVEGLKVVFNMVFQSPMLQIMFISNGILDGVINRLQDFTNPTEGSEYSLEFQYFTMRIFFLITALCQDTAPAKVRNLLNGLEVINNFLEFIILIPTNPSLEPLHLDDVTSDIICEVLKVIYNLIHDLVPKRNHATEADIDRDDLMELRRVTRSARKLLLLHEAEIQNADKRLEVKRHAVDLLAAIPPPCFGELTPELTGGEDEGQGSTEVCSFECYNMSAVDAVVKFLDAKLDDLKTSGSSDNLAPPLCALHNMAGSNRPIRKYLKLRILPPLNRKDVIDRPEIGSTIRNKLCNLLTSPVSHITELVANLLFILCKESVKKLIKYTGYGNAAGLLANRGLMLGGKAPQGKYSDSETESDTEDYKDVEHLINQVEGRIQLERPDPMEGMTDDRKEVEAMKLINIIDKMERNSAIRPCRIGPDGRPVPIQHVIQLQEALENPLKSLSRNDDDSDSSG